MGALRWEVRSEILNCGFLSWNWYKKNSVHEPPPEIYLSSPFTRSHSFKSTFVLNKIVAIMKGYGDSIALCLRSVAPLIVCKIYFTIDLAD